jgi:hypothetical protein
MPPDDVIAGPAPPSMEPIRDLFGQLHAHGVVCLVVVDVGLIGDCKLSDHELYTPFVVALVLAFFGPMVMRACG